jgi:hypothetical protein
MERKTIAGLSMKGGRKDNFTFCLLELYPDSGRWFLKSLLKVKDEDGLGGDEAIGAWIKDYDLKKLIVDFPLSEPACHQCVLACPGAIRCPVPEVKEVRSRLESILKQDEELLDKNPKLYEYARNRDDEIVFNKDVLKKESHEHILSRSFKRRLKKGFLPYWNRSIDFWVWNYYYDQLLDIFNISYDSFGNTSLMTQSRFAYLRRHFPEALDLSEGNTNIILIELLRAGIIAKRDIFNLLDIELGAEGRLDILKKIELRLGIFIYDHDLEELVKNPRAFDSFLLALGGKNIYENKLRELPEWTRPTETQFIVPHFS